MKRTLIILAAFAAFAAGCGDNQLPPPVTPPHGKVGSGAFNATYSETVSLTTGTVFSSARYIGSIDTVGIDLYAASGSAACTVGVEVSNRYNPATSSPTDDTLWVNYSSPSFVSPAALTGAVSDYLIELNMISPLYERLKFVCSSGSTSLTVTTQMKGG